MVYKKYSKKGGKIFGPYYYESYREGNKVKKIYIGGEKEYKIWLKKDNKKEISKKYVEQPTSSKSYSRGIGRFLFVLSLIILIFVILLNFGSIINNINTSTIGISLVGHVISENVSGESNILYGEYEKEAVVEQFDTDQIDLEIKEPAKFAGEALTKNKNKRMDFYLPEGNLILYFDLLNYSEFVENVKEVSEKGKIEIEKKENADLYEEKVVPEEIPEEDIPASQEANITIPEEIAEENVSEEVEETNVTTEEPPAEEPPAELPVEEPPAEELPAEEEPTSEPTQEPAITGAAIKLDSEKQGFLTRILKGFAGITAKIIGFDVLETDEENTTEISNDSFSESPGDLESNQTDEIQTDEIQADEAQTDEAQTDEVIDTNQSNFKSIQKKVEELNESELDIIVDNSVINAENFDVVVNKTQEDKTPNYKWGYRVKLKDLNFMAKIDVTSDKNVSIYNNDTLRIGNQLLSFTDLANAGYTVTIEMPALEMSISSLNISLGNIGEKETHIPEEVNVTPAQENLTTPTETNITEPIANEISSENVTEPIEQPQEETNIEEQAGNETGITGNIIRAIVGITGKVIDAVENATSNNEAAIEDLKYENTVTVYIERDFSDTQNNSTVQYDDTDNSGDVSVGDIVYLDPVLVSIDFGSTVTADYRTAQNWIWANVSASTDVSGGNVSTFIDFDNSLVGWWRMDDLNSSGGVVDYMGKNNLSKVGTAAQIDAGYLGKGFSFDGDSDSLKIVDPADGSLDFGANQNFSISFWMKANELGDNSRIIRKGADSSTNTPGYAVSWTTSSLNRTTFMISNATTRGSLASGNIGRYDIWHHFVIVANRNGNAQWYVDGVSSGSTLDISGYNQTLETTADFYIGGITGAYFNGTIDDVLIFNRSLSAAEIVGLYANTSTQYLIQNFTNLQNGSHTFNVYAQDTAGSVNSTGLKTISLNTSFDVTAPNLNITYPINTTYANYVTALNYTSNETESCWYSINSGTTNSSAVSAGTNWTNLNGNSSLGSNTWIVWCNDTAGNLNSSSVTFSVDNVFPAISYGSGTETNGSTLARNNIFVNVSANDTAVGNVSTFIDFDGSLVSWWRMDDINSSGGVVDYMGRNNGTAVGNAAQTDSGYLGKGFSFDGNGDYVNAGDKSQFDFNNSFAISVWFKWYSSAGSYHGVVAKGTNPVGYQLWIIDTALSVYLGNGTAWVVAIADGGGVLQGRWYHAVLNVNVSDAELWVGGIKKASDGIDSGLLGSSSGYSLYLGDAYTGDFNGTIDDVIIFNRSLSVAEIQGLYANTSSKYTAINYTSLADGSHSFKAYTQDMAGNVNSTETRSVTTETGIPIINITYPINTTYANYVTALNYTLNETGSCWYSINLGTINSSAVTAGTNWTGLNGNSSLGSNTWTVWCNDTANNINSSSVTFSVDNVVPNITYGTGTETNASTIPRNNIFVNVSANDTTGNVSTFINFDNSLVGWWRMDDLNSSGGVVDYMGRNNGSVTGAVQTDAGYLGKGFSFDGIDDYILVGSSWFPIGDITISTWIYADGWGESNAGRIIESQSVTGNLGQRFYLDGDFGDYNIGFTSKDGEHKAHSASSSISLNQWTHVVVTRIGSKAYFYINGIESDGDDSVCGVASGTGTNVYIGNDDPESHSFNGMIDDVIVFNRSLSAAEIQGLYANKSSEYLIQNFTSLADGSHSFKAYTQDTAGNVNSTETRTVATETGTSVTICRTLSTANTVYTLQSNITATGTCLNITASNITVNGNGYSMTGDGGETDYGITTPADSNLKNITIKNFANIANFTRGIFLDQVNNSLIYNNTMISQVAQSTYAVYIDDGNNNTIYSNNINWNATGESKDSSGVYLFVNSGKTLGNNNITGNNLTVYSQLSNCYGVYLNNSGISNSNTIQSNTIDVNASYEGYGVSLENYGTSMDSNIIQSNTIGITSLSYSYGVYFENDGETSNSNTIQSNTIDILSYDGYGVYLFNGGTSNLSIIESNTIDVNSSNDGYGIYLGNGAGGTSNSNTIQSNTIDITASSSTGTGYGVSLENYGTSNSNTIQSNTIDITLSYSGYGAHLYNNAGGTSNSNTIQSNTINITLSYHCYGVYLDNRETSNSNTIQSNTIDVNASSNGYGVYLLGFYPGTSTNSNTIYNQTINVYSSASASAFRSYGVILYNADYSNVSLLRINASAPSAYAGDVYLKSGSSGNVFYDNTLLGGNWSSYILANGGTNNTFLNVSYSGGEFVGTSSELIRKWYYSAYVNDTAGNNVSNANVTAYNITGTYQFNLTTGSDGLTGIANIIDYINNAGTKTYYSNYRIYAGNNSYATVSHTYNSTSSQNNLNDMFTLIGFPSGKKFVITNVSGANVASIDNKGDMYLKEFASESQASLTASPKSFVVQNKTGSTIAYVNSTGSLFLRGTITTGSDLSGRTSSNLEIRNSSNSLVAFFDNAGNLKLKGGVAENYASP